MRFTNRRSGPFSFLACEEWEDIGIRHGFIGASADFSSAAFASWEAQFLAAFEADAIFLPEQMHGASVIDLRSRESVEDLLGRPWGVNFAQGDAVIASRCASEERLVNRRPNVAFGIRTADCLPIMLLSSRDVALIHAGWRGLSAGIIEAAIERLSSNEVMQVLIGPAASQTCYEVGREVIEAIGEKAVHCVNSRGRYQLDLKGTARGIIEKSCPGAALAVSDVCTIQNESFHSFRRDGAPARSNLMFVVLEQAF